jgi:hypothetical protein
VLDVDLLALKEYEERLPIELTKTLMRFFSHTAKDAYLRKELGLLGQFLGSVTNEFLEGADTRGWTTLPKRVYFGALSAASSPVEIKVIGLHGHPVFRQTFAVEPDRMNVIQVLASPCSMSAQSVTFPPPGRRSSIKRVAWGRETDWPWQGILVACTHFGGVGP